MRLIVPSGLKERGDLSPLKRSNHSLKWIKTSHLIKGADQSEAVWRTVISAN